MVVIRFAIILLALSYVLLAFATTPFMLLLAGSCIGFSVGIAAPSVFAWAIDRSSNDNRGKALATVYIALEIGIGVGSLVSAWIYSNNPENFYKVMIFSAFISLCALFYLMIWNRRVRKEVTT